MNPLSLSFLHFFPSFRFFYISVSASVCTPLPTPLSLSLSACTESGITVFSFVLLKNHLTNNWAWVAVFAGGDATREAWEWLWQSFVSCTNLAVQWQSAHLATACKSHKASPQHWLAFHLSTAVSGELGKQKEPSSIIGEVCEVFILLFLNQQRFRSFDPNPSARGVCESGDAIDTWAGCTCPAAKEGGETAWGDSPAQRP